MFCLQFRLHLKMFFSRAKMKHILFNSPKHIFLFPGSTQSVSSGENSTLSLFLSFSQRKELQKLYYTFYDQQSRANSISKLTRWGKIHLDFVTLGVVLLLVKLLKSFFFHSNENSKTRTKKERKREKQKLKAKKSCESNKNTRNNNNN